MNHPTGVPARNHWPAIISIALGIFAMVTIEELPIGVLTLMSGELGVTDGTTGLTVTLTGVVAAFASIFAPTLVRTLDRRVVLASCLGLMTLASVGTALMPSFGWVLLTRLITGVSIGVFWAFAAPVGMTQVTKKSQALALTVIFSGVSAGVVLGVPLSTFIGTTWGWRAAFVVVACLGAAIGLTLLFVLPKLRVQAAARPSDLGRAWRIRGVRIGVLLTFLLIFAQFAAYTFASPALQRLAHVPVAAISGALLAYGIAGVVGNFAIGPMLRRSTGGAVLLVALGIGGSLVFLALVARTPGLGFAAMISWGLFGGAISVSLQHWILRAAKSESEQANALYSSAFNLSIASGAGIGGTLLDQFGPQQLLLLAAAGCLAAGIVAFMRHHQVLDRAP